MPDSPVTTGREVTVRIGEDDLVAAQKLLMRANYRNPVKLAAMLALWLALAIVLFLLFGDDLPWAIPLVAAVAALSTFLVPPLILLAFGPVAARRNLRAVPAFGGPLHYAWSEEGFACETVSGRSFQRWPAFRRWLEDDKLMLVWPHPLTYQLLPKRDFTPAQIAEIRGFLRAAREP